MGLFKKKEEKKTENRPVNEGSVRGAYETLQKYKAGKSSLEQRIIENDEWWRMRLY